MKNAAIRRAIRRRQGGMSVQNGLLQMVVYYLHKHLYSLPMKQTLGTQLRHLIDLLDGSVAAAYDEAGLAYRPRYTPIIRALMTQQPLTIGQIAEIAGITQPAVTQTIALMVSDDLVWVGRGAADGRQKLISLTPHGQRLLPALQRCWAATAQAAASLEADLSHSLTQLLSEAIGALQQSSFASRIQQARAKLDTQDSKAQAMVSTQPRNKIKNKTRT